MAAYDMLMQIAASPVVELNRAVAVAMHDGPAAGLALIDAILARGDLVLTIWLTPRGRNSAGCLEELQRLKLPTSEPSALHNKVHGGGFLSSGWPTCRIKAAKY